MASGDLIELAMCGSASEECNPYELVRGVERQRLLLLLNMGPRSLEDVARSLGLPVETVKRHVEELVSCGLVRRARGGYGVGFSIFTVGDQELLLPLVRELAMDVVEVVENWLPRIRHLLEDFTVSRRGLGHRDLDYIVVGAIGLDYEGLEVLSEEGLIVRSKPMPGGEYVLAGFEKGGPLTRLSKAFMWGHHSVFGKYWFNTHGGLPPSGRRLAFPDLAWLWYMQGVGLDTIQSVMETIGRILEELLYSDLSVDELRQRLGVDEATLATNLALLHVIGYVKPLPKRAWRLNIPVLRHDEYTSARELVRKMLKDVALAFKRKLEKAKKIYQKTTPARNNIPFEEAFNQIYHLVFSTALHTLVEKGAITKPSKRVNGGTYSAFLVILED